MKQKQRTLLDTKKSLGRRYHCATCAAPFGKRFECFAVSVWDPDVFQGLKITSLIARKKVKSSQMFGLNISQLQIFLLLLILYLRHHPPQVLHYQHDLS